LKVLFLFLVKMVEAADADGFPSDVALKLLQFDKAARAVTEHFRANGPSVTSMSSSGDQGAVDPLLKAKVNMAYLFSVYSQFWVYLRLRGQDPKDHAIRNEMSTFCSPVRCERVMFFRSIRPHTENANVAQKN
jgi:hypothetical protein